MELSPHTLVTGASSGLGRRTAISLSGTRNLILHGRDADRLEETRLLCAEPERHLVWRCDLENVDELAGSLSPLLVESGRAIDAFVHCAGMVTVLPMRSVDARTARALMNVNFFSAAEIVRVLLGKKTNDRRVSNVIFISSLWSRFGARGHSMYCASKAALDGLMRGLAVELAPAVRVNSILPGAIETPMATSGMSDPVILEKLQSDYPMGLGRPEDVADAVEFLLSDRARWVTGQQIGVDGGRSANMSLK